MKKFLGMSMMMLATASAQANSFKVGPASSSDKMDFTTISAAMNSASVNNGDTLWLDKNYYNTSSENVTKGVTIIGTGYDENQTSEKVVAYAYQLNLKADNINVKSLKLSFIYFHNDNCLVDRCYTNYIFCSDAAAGSNTVRSSYITGMIQGYSSSPYSTINLYNNVIYSNYSSNGILSYLNNSDIQYNTIIYYSSYYKPLYYIYNSSIKNNIILHTQSSYYDYIFEGQSGNSIDHNILSYTSSSNFSSFPENKFGYGGASSTLFTCTGSYSDYYKLASASPAKGYATDGGEVGCHGGMFGNPAGGRPQYVPYFSNVVVGSKSTDGKLPVSVSVKIQNK